MVAIKKFKDANKDSQVPHTHGLGVSEKDCVSSDCTAGPGCDGCVPLGTNHLRDGVGGTRGRLFVRVCGGPQPTCAGRLPAQGLLPKSCKGPRATPALAD